MSEFDHFLSEIRSCPTHTLLMILEDQQGLYTAEELCAIHAELKSRSSVDVAIGMKKMKLELSAARAAKQKKEELEELEEWMEWDDDDGLF